MTLIDTHLVAYIHSWKRTVRYKRTVRVFLAEVLRNVQIHDSYLHLKTLPKAKRVCYGQVRPCNLTVNPPNRLMALSAGKQFSMAKQQGLSLFITLSLIHTHIQQARGARQAEAGSTHKQTQQTDTSTRFC